MKVLNIAGCGRSGSTLLANALGQLPGYLHVGELCYIWNRGILRNAMCGCGAYFHDCAFWGRVLERSGLTTDRDTAERLARFPRAANRRLALALLRGRGPLELAPGIEEYVDALNRLYRALADETGCRVVVDSTKAPSHAYLLGASSDLDVRVVHLVRDSRAVAFSWSRRKMRDDTHPSDPTAMPRFSAVRSALKWSYANVGVEMLRGRARHAVHLVRYEDFLADPRTTIREVADFAGEPAAATPLVGDRAIRLDAQHTVWGNPGRLRTGVVELRLDAEWKERMGPLPWMLVTGLTWPLERRYAAPRSKSHGHSAGSGAL